MSNLDYIYESWGCIELDGEPFEVYFEIHEGHHYTFLWPRTNEYDPSDYEDLLENSTMLIKYDMSIKDYDNGYCTASDNMSDETYNKIREWFKENGRDIPPRGA